VEKELLTLPEHLSSFLVFVEVRVVRSLVFCVVFCRPLFVLFLLAIAVSVLLFTASDYCTPLVSSNFSYEYSHVFQCSHKEQLVKNIMYTSP
jgi:hypothetical protein